MLRVYAARWTGNLVCGQRACRLPSTQCYRRRSHSAAAAARVTSTSSTGAIAGRRGKKTKTTVSLADLPQGLVPREKLSDLEVRDEEPAYPTVVLQARRNMQKFANCVLLTRVGGFYELYFEHAEEYGPLLNIKVASKKTSAGPVPMV